MQQGKAVLANIVLLGVLAASEILPLQTEILEEVLTLKLARGKVRANIAAFEAGQTMIQTSSWHTEPF